MPWAIMGGTSQYSLQSLSPFEMEAKLYYAGLPSSPRFVSPHQSHFVRDGQEQVAIDGPQTPTTKLHQSTIFKALQRRRVIVSVSLLIALFAADLAQNRRYVLAGYLIVDVEGAIRDGADRRLRRMTPVS